MSGDRVRGVGGGTYEAGERADGAGERAHEVGGPAFRGPAFRMGGRTHGMRGRGRRVEVARRG